MLKLHGTPWNLKCFFSRFQPNIADNILRLLANLTHSTPWKMGPRMFHHFSVWRNFFRICGVWKFGVSFQGMWGKIIELCLTFFETCEETGYPPGNWHIPPWENNSIVFKKNALEWDMLVPSRVETWSSWKCHRISWVVMILIGWADVRKCLAILLWFDCWNVTFCQAVNTIMAYFESMQFESSYEQRERQLIECKWSKKISIIVN